MDEIPDEIQEIQGILGSLFGPPPSPEVLAEQSEALRQRTKATVVMTRHLNQFSNDDLIELVRTCLTLVGMRLCIMPADVVTEAGLDSITPAFWQKQQKMSLKMLGPYDPDCGCSLCEAIGEVDG